MRPRRGRDGWGGTREAIPEQVMKARNMGLIIDPMEKYWVWWAVKIKEFWFFGPVEDLGGLRKRQQWNW